MGYEANSIFYVSVLIGFAVTSFLIINIWHLVDGKTIIERITDELLCASFLVGLKGANIICLTSLAAFRHDIFALGNLATGFICAVSFFVAVESIQNLRQKIDDRKNLFKKRLVKES